MNVLKRRALILALLVLCLIGMTILGASAAVDTTTATTTQTADSVASATVTVGDAAPALYYYTDLATAIAEADENTTVTLLKDVTLSAEIAVEKALTINGDGHTISTTATRNMFRVFASVNFVDVTITNTYANGRCIDTRTDDIEVNLTNVTLDTTGVTSGNDQPLTIGGSDMDGLTITLTNSTIKTSKSGYAAIIFVPVELTITDSELTGYGVIYAREGSAGSVVTVEGSTLTSNNVHSGESNSFAAIVFEESGVELSLSKSQIATTATGDQAQSAFGMKNNAVADITIDAATTFDIADANDSVFLAFDNANPPTLNVAADNAAVKELLNNEGFVAEDYDNNGFLDVAPPVEEGKSYVARVGTVLYTTLDAALAAAGNGDTVYVLADVTLDSAITINNEGIALTLDLGGKTITATKGAFILKAGTLTVQNGTIAAQNDAFVMGTKGLDPDPVVVLNFEESLTVTSQSDCCAVVYAGTLNTKGTLVSNSAVYCAIQGSGNPGNTGTAINVLGGSITAANTAAIYQPQDGALTISGGTVSGKTAVYVKAGSVNMTGGKLVATGDKAAYNPYNDGFYPTGDALVIDSAEGYAPVSTVVIKPEATFESANGSALGSFTNIADATPVVPDAPFVAKIGGNYYTTLADALQAAAAVKGSTLYMLADTTLDASDSIILSGAEFTIEGNGKTITAGTSVAKSGSIKLIEGGILSVKNVTFAGYTGKNLLYTGDTSATTYTYTVNFTGVTLNYASSGAFYGYQHASTAISLKDCVVNVLNFDSTRSLVNFTNAAASQNFTLTLDNTTLTDGANIVNPSFPFVASVGKSYFTNFATAVAAAQDGDTVYVLKNIENAPTTSYITKTITVEGVNADIAMTTAAKAILFNIGDNGHLTVKNLKITSDNFVVFRQSTAGASASVTLESGAIVTNIDLAAYNDILVYNAGGANANLTVNIKAGASLITKSLSEVAPSYATIYAGTGTSITVNVWGTLKNIAQAPAGKNAQVLTVKGKTNNATLNIYEGAVIEGTSDSATYSGNYAGIVYFSEATNVINMTGGTVTIHGVSGFAYAGTKATITLSGGTINNTEAAYALFFGGSKTVTVSKNVTINNNKKALANSATYSFEDDATALKYGMTVRVGDTEGGAVYHANLTNALNAVSPSNTTVTNVYLLANTTMANVGSDGGEGTYFDAKYRSKVHITSKGTTPFTVTSSGTINFYLGSGAEIKFTNLVYNVGVRLARIDGSCTMIFGEGCTMNCKDTILIYDNGNTLKNDYKAHKEGNTTVVDNPSYIENLAYSFIIEKGAVINSTGAIATALIYRSSNVSDANITLKIAGKINMTASKPIFSDNGKATVTVYYDASTAEVTCPSNTWFSNTFRQVGETGGAIGLYAKGFATTAEAAEFGAVRGGGMLTGMTYNADPAAEWSYTYLNYGQFTPLQCTVLNSHGGEIWQLKSNNSAGIYTTVYLTNLGTVTFKSYNGAKILLQANANRIQVKGTTVILDGITLQTAGSIISIYTGTEAAPSVLKLINGAKIVGTATQGSGKPIVRFLDSNCTYASLYVDKTSEITLNADLGTGNALVIYTDASWANGSIVIEGKLNTTGSTCANSTLIAISGAANGCSIVLDGATLAHSETATGTKKNLNVVANTYNGSVELKNGVTTDLVYGIVASDSTGKLFGSITGAVNFAPVGTPVTITLSQAATFASSLTIENKFITIVGLDSTIGDDTYDLKYTGSSGYAFTMVNLGSLTFQNVNFYAGRPLMLYKSTALDGVDQANKDLTLSLVNSYIKVVGSSRFIASSNAGSGNTQCDTLTINVDENSTMYYESTSGDRRSMFEFYHASHKYIVMNIDGTLSFKDHVTSDNAAWFLVSNNPSAATITFSETAQLNIDIANATASDWLFYLTTGTNKLTIHENAITDDQGKLTLGGLKLFRQYSAGASPAVTIIAKDATNQATLLGLVAEDKDSSTFAPISWLTVKEGVYYYGTFNAVLAAAEDKGTVTLLQSSAVFSSALLSGKEVTITAVENAVLTNATTTNFVQMGSNTVLNVTNFKYQGNAFLVFTNPNGAATLNLNDGAIIEGGDPTASAMITTASDAKGAVTLNIGEKAQLVRPASYTVEASTKEIVYFRNSAQCNVTLNVYGKFANLTTVNGAYNATLFDHCLKNATCTINIYDGAEIEGTTASTDYNGQYQGLFYCAPNGSNINYTYFNIYGGKITSHGRNPLAYFDTNYANVRIEGAPEITLSNLEYGVFWFNKTTNTSLSIGIEDNAVLDINGKEYYCGNKPVIYAVSGITDEAAVAAGMFFRYDGVYYKTLADAIALVPDGATATIYVLAPATISATTSITNKKVTLTAAEGVTLTADQNHLSFTADYAFDISNAGTLTFKNVKVSVTGTLVRYLAAASAMAKADRDIYVNFVGTTVTANGSAAYFITSGSDHHGDTEDTPADQKKAGDSVTVTVDADSVINFTTSATGAVYFIDYNKNTHVNVTTVIDGIVNITLTGDSENAFQLVHSNNPSSTKLTISETAQLTVVLPTQRAATGKNFIISSTGGGINDNKLTIHLDAILDADGAMTLSGLKLYDAYFVTGDFDVCLIASTLNADLEAVLTAWAASHGAGTGIVAITPVAFRTQVGELYYYGSLNAVFAAAEDKGTITVLTNAALLNYAELSGEKAVTLTGATTDIVLTVSSNIKVNNGASLTVKDITINSATANVFYTSTAGNALTLDGVTVNYTAAASSNFIGVATGAKLALTMKNVTFNATNETRMVYVQDGAALTSMKYENVNSTNGVLAMVQGATATIGSAAAPAEIIDSTGGLIFYAYNGAIYANIYGGTFTTLLYGGDDCTNTLDIKINPTGDKTTTFTRATASDANHYSAFVHLHPETDKVQNVSFLLRNVTYTDTGAAPLFAIRDLATVSISVENSTFELNGAMMSSLTSSNGVTFDSDATARLFGYGARIGAEGESLYYNDVYYALANVANGGTITIVADVKQTGEFGLNKTVTITSPEGEKYTVTTNANVPFYFQTNANLTIKNVNYNLGVRFGRFDGNSTLTLGDGANIVHNNAIFLYNNGNCTAQPVYTIDIQKGATITCSTAMGNGLIYSNAAGAAKSNVTVKIAGTVTTANSPIVKDVDGATHGVSIYRVYIDATSAVINTGTAAWAAAGGKDLAIFYNGTFESNAAAAEWAYGTGAYGLTINNDPEAEYKYSMTYDSQFLHAQHNVLNSNGGELWQLRTNANGAGIYQTMQFINEGTVTIKSYNGALISLQNSVRFRVQNTTLILDGITIRLDGGSSIGIHGGSEAAPSMLKLVNGATVTGAAANAGQLIYFMADNGGQYSHLYVDETSSIVQTAPSAAQANNTHVVWTHGNWANGSITIKGTVSSASSAGNVYLLTLTGNGTNEVILDGATLSITGTATGTAALINVSGGCHAVLDFVNNPTLEITGTAATKKTMIVTGAVSFKGLTGEAADAKADEYGLTVGFNGVYSQVLSTAIINQIPEGGKGEIVLTSPIQIPSMIVIFNRDVTLVGANRAEYDITYTGSSDYVFQIQNVGKLTLKNLNIKGGRPLIQYCGVDKASVAQADRDIEINLINTKVDITGSSVLINSGGHHGNVANKKCDSIVVNIDKDCVINYTATSTGEIYCISFNHNTHPYVTANIHGTLNYSSAASSNTYAYLVRSNNPSSTKINITETAHVTMNIPTGDAFITSCTGGNSTTNVLTIHLSAISKDGALTLGGAKVYSAYTTACTFTAHIIADDNTMAEVVQAWTANNSNTGGTGGALTEYPFVASIELDGKYHYSSLGGVIALIPDGATKTITITSSLTSAGTIVINNKTITLEGVGATKPTLTLTGNPAFQLGDNSHLIFKNLDIIATSNFILTNGTDTKATTKIDIESGVTIDVRHYNGAYFFRAGSVGILTMNIKAGSSVKLLTDGTVRDGAVQGMFDFTSYSNKVAEGSVINVDGQVIYGLKFKGEVAGNSRSAMFKIGDNTIDVIFTANADIQLLHQNAIGGTWNAIVCLDSSSANTIVTFTGSKITLAAQCAIYGLNGTNFNGTYLVKDITLQSSGSFLVSDYAAAGGVNSTTIKFSGFALNGNALTQNNKLPYAVLMNIGFASEAEAFASNAYFTLIPGTYSNLGGAIEAAEDGATIYVNTSLVLTSATITNKSLTFAGAVDGIVITNASSGYLFTLGSGAHLTIKNLTYEGNYFAQFTAAAGTTSSLTLGEGTSIIGGALEKDAYIFYGASLKGATVITIGAGASVIRPDTYTLTDAANPCPAIYRFQTSGAYTLNVYGELKNLTTIAPGVRALTQIGYCNSQNGMIVNIYDGAEIEGTSDSTAHKGYYQGIFYFAVYGANKHEFNIYGGTIVSHGMCSMIYFGNNYVTVRIKGTPTILMPDATYNMICLHNTKGAADSQTEFYADVEVGATINLNGNAFFWHASTEVSEITAGKFFTDDNAASYGAGYRIVDENGLSRYVAGLGAAAAMSRNGGTIWLIGDVSDGGAGVVVNKYLFLKPVKPGYTITIGGSAPAVVINGGSATSPARFYIEDINFAGASTSTLFQVEGGGHAIIEMTNCNMNGGAGVIQMYDAAVATVTLTNGSYSMSAKPFYAIGYSDITVNATNITFTGTGTGDANSLFHLDGNAVGHWNIKGGSATTKWHTFYIRNVSTAFVNIEDFAIISDQWCFSSQSSSNWRVNLKNVDMVAKNCTATRMYGAAGSYINIMGGSITSLKKDTTNKATMTFGNSIQVNIFDAYVHSAAMSAISGLAATVNINIYGGTYLYNGTEVSYAPIMLPQAGNLTVKGGTFINTNSTGPVFSNTAVTANKLLLEAYNAIGSSSYLVLNSSATGTPTTMLGAYGRASLNSLTMTRGAKPGNIHGIDPTKGEMTFKVTVDKAAYEYMTGLSATGNVKFGMLVVPTALLNEGVDFTHFGLKNYTNIFGDNLELGVDYFDYTAEPTEEKDGCWTFQATHTGIDADNYNTKYSAVFYAEYEVTATDASGNAVVTGKTESGMDLTTAVVYRYADYDESDNARTLAEVAYAAYHDADYAGDKATLETWCGGDVAEKTVDIFLMAGGSNAAGNTPFSKEYAASLIDHVCANCGHVADEELFAAASYTCVNELVHGKTLTVEDGNCICTCGFTCPENEAPADMKCPKTLTCGAAKATFQNVLKNPITNVFYSGIVSDAAGSKSASICSPVTLGLGWNGNMGPEFGMANKLAEYYNATTPGKYAAIMKYAMNDAALVAEDAQFGNFSGKLYDSFIQMVEDQIGDYVNLGYKVNVAGFYWMQGEADIAVADAYAEALQKLIANVRADLAEITGDDMADLPVVVGEIATFTGAANSADRVALKNAQNAVTGVIIDNTSAYIADANGIFIDAQNVLDTGARVVAKILNATNADIVVPKIEATTEIIDPNGIEIPGHTSLAMSLIAAPSGSTITLKADQTVYASMTVADRDDLVIDGSGNAVTIVTDAPAFVLQGANVTLENIVVNHNGNAAAITLDNDSTLTVEEGAEITAKRTAIEMTGAASKLVVNGGIFATTDAAATDAIIRTASANVTITDGIFTAADGSSVISIDKNATHKLIVNVMGGTFVAEDKMVEKVDAQGQFIPGEYDTIEAITFVNNCPTAILVIDPDVLAANPTLDVFNVAAQ